MTWEAITFQKTGRPLRCFATKSAVAEAHLLDKDTKIKTVLEKNISWSTSPEMRQLFKTKMYDTSWEQSHNYSTFMVEC